MNKKIGIIGDLIMDRGGEISSGMEPQPFKFILPSRVFPLYYPSKDKSNNKGMRSKSRKFK